MIPPSCVAIISPCQLQNMPCQLNVKLRPSPSKFVLNFSTNLTICHKSGTILVRFHHFVSFTTPVGNSRGNGISHDIPCSLTNHHNQFHYINKLFFFGRCVFASICIIGACIHENDVPYLVLRSLKGSIQF